MQNLTMIKRVVLMFLVLHTAIILMLALVFKRGEALEADPVILVAGILLVVAITIYTAYRIIETIKEKLELRVRKMAEYAEYLQSRTRDLDNYAVELKRWAEEMNKQQAVLKQRVRVINEYGNRMNELAVMMDIKGGAINA